MSIEINTQEESYFICSHDDGGNFENLPWNTQEFDVIICILNTPITLKSSFLTTIEKLVITNCDWIDVIGLGAEYLHDQIDLASVKMGRQIKVGDGSPMTTWNEESLTHELAADWCFDSILGGHDNRLIMIVGDFQQFNEFIDVFQKKIKKK